MVEGVLWLLMTGEIPRKIDAQDLMSELHSRAKVPLHVYSIIDSFPKNMHPMTQFSAAVLALQTESLFVKDYSSGIHKKLLWEAAYEDALNAIATIPLVASRIYRNCFKPKDDFIVSDSSLDYAANYAHLLGKSSKEFHDLMRMYLIIHADHEGGNVSAHTTHLVGSALSDPYLSLSAGLSGLAGPLHGRASQEVMEFLIQVDKDLKGNFTKESIKAWAEKHLASGKVIPGYGHAVLRKTDPRYTCQREFALKHLPQFPYFKLVSLLYEIVPDVLVKAGKAKNPWPNVDAHSGTILNYYGLKEVEYYTILFGVSRAIGVLSSLVWDRILGFPLERPKSVTTEWILKNQQDLLK
jgi:citrate synthase